mmetsp:Transcript_15763/g.24185  ORF Transcript_15763/g.24185 Transcript_15763/m.24185 type:complete len:200 (-) Transcript_15763:3-602(-)
MLLPFFELRPASNIDCNQGRRHQRQETMLLLRPLLDDEGLRQLVGLLPLRLPEGVAKRNQQLENVLPRKYMHLVHEPRSKKRNHFVGFAVVVEFLWNVGIAKCVARCKRHQLLHAIPTRLPFVGFFGILPPFRVQCTNRIRGFVSGITTARLGSTHFVTHTRSVLFGFFARTLGDGGRFFFRRHVHQQCRSIETWSNLS